jgi:hypothetical protein
MQPLVNGEPGPFECWDELAEHSLTHDDLPVTGQSPAAPSGYPVTLEWQVTAECRTADGTPAASATVRGSAVSDGSLTSGQLLGLVLGDAGRTGQARNPEGLST